MKFFTIVIRKLVGQLNQKNSKLEDLLFHTQTVTVQRIEVTIVLK
jgi:hypothetical protein